MKRIQCFIACAFGKEDVDQLYENAIKKVLQKLSINGVRVDRVNHNEKIDHKIIELINKSDFGIADLTYARPSVYFEAGLLEGQGKQVIFLARNDHLVPKPDDTYGNFKIHFDLITKNIISWQKIDSYILEKISKRVNLVIKPIQENIKKDLDLQVEKDKFNSLSIDDRITLLSDTTNGYLRVKFPDIQVIRHTYEYISAILKIDNEDFHALFLFSDFFKKATLKAYNPFGIAWTYLREQTDKDIKKKLIFLISIRGQSILTIDSCLNMCSKNEEKTYRFSFEHIFTFQYFILDRISFPTDLINRLSNHIDKIITAANRSV